MGRTSLVPFLVETKLRKVSQAGAEGSVRRGARLLQSMQSGSSVHSCI